MKHRFIKKWPLTRFARETVEAMGKKRVLLLNGGSESLLNISFLLQLSGYSPLLFHSPEEVINWITACDEAVGLGCLLIHGFNDSAELAKLRQLLITCRIEMPILLVGGSESSYQSLQDSRLDITACEANALTNELLKLYQQSVSPRSSYRAG